MLREDLGPSVEAHSRRWELVVNAYLSQFRDGPDILALGSQRGFGNLRGLEKAWVAMV
jgi:hypothetical protein